tara:strand:+ start:486 stop:707 length:222 start_codon:yes stop_codon:yes gene_type:complete
MDTIPTYYADLIKENVEHLKHLQCRWLQLHSMRNNAINAGKAERAEEIKAQMFEISKRFNVITDKLAKYAAKR